MGKCILHMDGKFMHWHSVTDSPSSPLLPEDLFKQYWLSEYGRSGMVDYANDIEQAKKTGCSAIGYTIASVIRENHAGNRGKRLSKAEIIDLYTLTDPKEFEKWNAARTKAFEKMAIEFGPEGRIAKNGS